MQSEPSDTISIIAEKAEVISRIKSMAADVVAEYRGKSPLFVCLLRGGVPFASQLMFAITEISPDFYPELEYLRVQTYADGRTAGEPKISPSFAVEEFEGRTVVLLDDVLDTGRTPAAVESYAKEHGAKEVDLIVLTQKQRGRDYWQEATMYGFDFPDVWQVGMGCDNTATAPEAYRWTPYIGAVTDKTTND